MEERLHYLFKLYLDNSCSQEELEEFFSYVHKSDHDAQLRDLIRKVYEGLNDIGVNGTYVDEKGRLVLPTPEWTPVAQAEPAEPVTQKSRPYAKYLVAAMLLLVACSIWLMQTSRPVRDRTMALSSLTKKETNRSESKYLLLADSTQVWLNAASSLQFPDQFDPAKREVFLTGEAFFDVKHTDRIPFVIHTGKISTTVLGTAFNIKAYPDQKNITISVSKGKVRVTGTNGWATTLSKGQQIKVKDDGMQAMEKTIPAEKVASWQQGNLVYDDEVLGDIIADMQRIYNVNIEVNDGSIGDLKISTSFKREIGIEQALQVLCRLTDTQLTQSEGVYLIQ
jgi:ferric-dicitrate binding protein FerR (iron transport regulator)